MDSEIQNKNKILNWNFNMKKDSLNYNLEITPIKIKTMEL